jgi:hypothetical protein
MQGWISGLRLGPNSARKIIADVSQVFAAALDDGIITRKPLKARSVQKPQAVRTEATPWTAAEVEAVADQLPVHLAALPTREGADHNPCALIVPGDRNE